MDGTKSRKVVVEVNERIVTCFTIGGLAAALGRTPHTIRRWERIGLLPKAPLLLDSDAVCTKRRLYPVELIEALRAVAVREGFGLRRPSGVFLRQQEQFIAAWKAALGPLLVEETGVGGECEA